jgi:hypothetical protein
LTWGWGGANYALSKRTTNVQVKHLSYKMDEPAVVNEFPILLLAFA